MNTIIITGDRQGGKTYFLSHLYTLLINNGKDVCGFLSEGRVREEGYKDFYLRGLGDNKYIHLASRMPLKDYSRHGRYFFNPLAIKEGIKIIERGLGENNAIFILDEIGPAEVSGNVWYSALRKIIDHNQGTLVISVRKRLVQKVVRQFGIKDPDISDIAVADPGKVLQNILRNSH